VSVWLELLVCEVISTGSCVDPDVRG